MKRDRRRFDLSPEATALLAQPEGRWEHVELADGPAAQGMVPGVKGRPTPAAVFAPDPAEDRDDLTADLFDGGKP